MMKYLEPKMEVSELELVRTDVVASSEISDGTNEDGTKVPEIWP